MTKLTEIKRCYPHGMIQRERNLKKPYNTKYKVFGNRDSNLLGEGSTKKEAIEKAYKKLLTEN